MLNTLLISGSPRDGNTDFVLKALFQHLPQEKELIFLREKQIGHCLGCQACENSDECIIADGMGPLYRKIVRADVLVVGSPNYFDNVSGLLKDFMDRTSPLYHKKFLSGKKFLSVIVGGGKEKYSQRVGDYLSYFAKSHGLVDLGCYCFSALCPDELKKSSTSGSSVQEIIETLCKV